MNKRTQLKHRQQLCQALRSGEYTQATGRHAYIDEQGVTCYCLIGLGYKLMPNKLARYGNIPQIGQQDIPARYAEIFINGSDKPMTHTVDHVGRFPTLRDGQFATYYGFTNTVWLHLSEQNDVGVSFPELATIIEELV